jgi:DNA integrity scanning protein DisA with diadenylate cyclase activity
MDQEKLKLVTGVLSQVTDLLYQENITYAYRMLAIILSELETVISMVEDKGASVEIKDKLMEALQAMEEEDNILLADIIQYEINERLLGYLEE